MKWKYVIRNSFGNENLRGKKARIFNKEQSTDIFGVSVFVEIDDKCRTKLWMSKSDLKEIKK